MRNLANYLVVKLQFIKFLTVHFKQMSIRRLAFLFQFILIGAFFFLFSIIWIFTEYSDYLNNVETQVRQSHYQNKKLLQQKVDETISLIDYINKNRHFANDSIAKNFILDFLSQNRFGGAGYIFINNIDGKALIFDGKRVENKNIRNIKDKKGNSIFEMEISGYNSSNGKFINYYFKRLDDTIEHEKIAFIKGYHAFNWIVGAGNYPDEFLKNDLNFIQYTWDRFSQRAFHILLVFVIFIFIFYLSSKYISKTFLKMLLEVNEYFNKKMEGDKNATYDLDNVLIEELAELINSFDRMTDKKIELENALNDYNNQLEILVNSRTEELKKKSEILEDKNKDLQRLNKLFSDREFRIKELRDKIIELEEEINLLQRNNN